MLVLFETPAGFALFKVLDQGKLSDTKTVEKNFLSAKKAQGIVKLKSFDKFANTIEATKATAELVEGKLGKSLKSFLKNEVKSSDQLIVSDKVIGGLIQQKLGIQCIFDKSTNELMRGIRNQISSLLSDVTSEQELNQMSLGLSHSLSRYKLKFSPDKIDTMIVQAIGLLDDMDKELNIYAMRVKEWYGWHFPELVKIVPDNMLYARTARLLQNRNNAANIDLHEVLPEEMAQEVKDAAIISMGTEINEEDVSHIVKLCDEVIGLTEYRGQLFEYLKNRMQSIAPNLTHLVGELVGARLIAHAGSLLNLAKHPASTVQILGAEKAFFRALKSNKNTPKYGLLYNASLIGSAPAKYKGKIARVLAAKCAISSRVDAMGEKEHATIGVDSLEKVEARLRTLEGYTAKSLTGAGAKGQKQTTTVSRSQSHPAKLRGESTEYSESADVTSIGKKEEKKDKKADKMEVDSDEAPKKEMTKEEKKKAKEEKKKEKKEKKEQKKKEKEEKKKEKEERKKEKKDKKRKREENGKDDSEPKKKKSKKDKKSKSE